VGRYPTRRAQFALRRSFFVPLFSLPCILTQFPQDLHPPHRTPTSNFGQHLVGISVILRALIPPARSCVPQAKSPLAHGMVWDEKESKTGSMWRSRWVATYQCVLISRLDRSVSPFSCDYVLCLAYRPNFRRTYAHRVALHSSQLSHSHRQLRPTPRRGLHHSARPHPPRTILRTAGESPLVYGMVWDEKDSKNKSMTTLMWRLQWVVIQ
jgi:hypothetical protein